MKRGYWWPDGYCDLPGLSLKCVGEWNERSGADSDGEFSHPFWVVEHVRTDFGEIFCNGAWQERRPGSVLVIRPHTRYRRRGAKSLESHAAYIGFRGGEGVGLDAAMGARDICLLDDPDALTGECLSRGAVLAQTMGESAYWRVLGVLHEVVGLLLAVRPGPDGLLRIAGWDRAPSESSPLVSRVRAVLSKHLHRRLPLQELARGLGVSVSTLTHAYARAAGESPQATHMSMRLEQAREMLLMGASIKGLARQYGFSDVHHFTKAFGRQYGMSPAVYRARRLPR